MKIEAIKAALPTKKLTNDDVLALIEEYSKPVFSGDLKTALSKINFFLRYSGSDVRYWLDKNEKPIDLVNRAFQEALAEANCDKDDIDLLVYTGIGRGFIEPAAAYHVAAYLGLQHAECFDILDACMSWTRVLNIVYSLFKAGRYKRALIVNAECNMHYGGPVFPTVFQLPNVEAIEWSFPAYTLGEAATATIVSYDPDQEWEFHFKSRPDLAELCNVPLIGYEGYCTPSERIGLNGINKFTSFGVELHANAYPEFINIFNRLKAPVKEIRAVFPHASSKREWDKVAEALNIKHLMWHIYPTCGNVVSASVPTGIASAISAKQIQRGDRIAIWVGSAGMSFSSCSFIY
ncbi:MAG: 3-oxoacyl-[acyl-carrier-protein] synthase III C-terminal domain-containing protein [Sphaerospermopsis kisseleviana]|uniref:3-oxoacyl-[acyl-carrier-protein] synthase III C-terminal domain-containing protein n=1 Tax=Sphaerospermopsis sp. LEGE 00249 TaxID=1380707 RepID=UPI00164CE109|nr:3-oxoacyl-[acyl-carrier-protein] synthase III C-terminal domain-containing protein [Sphaerospermopsis sp. LEGE 00249]MBC5793745.1 3-oxoacyl-ACP reductase [Sphaerospermopsis sp. LEGE 00249]